MFFPSAVYKPLLSRYSKSLKRCLGFLPHYSQWIPAHSDRIKTITGCKSFPLSQQAVQAFESVKKTMGESVVAAIDDSVPSEVETDASNAAASSTDLGC